MGALVDIDLKIIGSVRGKFVSFLLTENIREVMIFHRNAFEISKRLRFQSQKSPGCFVNFKLMEKH
jgi:hypothetical protein